MVNNQCLVKNKKNRVNKTFQKVRLSLATPRTRKHIIRDADESLLNALSECCLNVLKDTYR